MTITPQGNIYLCRTPLINDYKNQLTFTNLQAQINYFNSTIQNTLTEYTYIKRDNVINVGVNIDSIIQCNYLFYRNNGFTNKYYFCFITNMQYINENCTAITFETDCFQTWQFDIKYNKCFIEREHVQNDSIGLHTVPEGLELGELTTAKECEKKLNNPTDYYICMAVTELPDESIPPYTNHRVYTGIFGGLYYLAFRTASNVEIAIKMYDVKGKAEAINSIFMIPKNLGSITSGTNVTWTIPAIGSCSLIYLTGSKNSDLVGTINGSMPSKLGNNYIPRNNKLFTYPYSYMNLTNNSGQTISFKYEDFTIDNGTRVIAWNLLASITPSMSIKAVPLFYKNINVNYNYGMMLGKLPVCSWNSDVYLNWLTQNGLNATFDVVESGLNLAGSIASSSPVGITNSLANIYNSVHQFTLADMTPNQAKGNTNSGDINFSYEYDGGLTLYYMSVRDEFAQIIDNYFDMFGYKINTVAIPYITGRRNWNYVKTINCNFTGNIPQSDINIIRQAFDNGITLWHNSNTIFDYSQSNDIL